jgi:dipeptidyl aminopeptidase/acylaminoacyl peptidase
MKICVSLVASAASLLFLAAPAHAGESIASDAQAFGTRENVQYMDISPSGNKIAMLVSGPQSSTVLQVVDLTTGQILNLTKNDGRPVHLRTCDFGGESRLVCMQSRVQRMENIATPLTFTHLFEISADGKDFKDLGQRGTDRDDGVRQSDGSVIDWLPDEQGAVLLQRVYIPQVYGTGRLMSRTEEGLGVDHIDLATLKSKQVEPPHAGVDDYMTDGRGNVRLEIIAQGDTAPGELSGVSLIRYRTNNSRIWQTLGTYDERNHKGIVPLAVDATTDSLYALQKLGDRDALYRIKLDGTLAQTLVASDRSVDIDDVVRLGRGQRVIGYTYADDRRRTVYFDPELGALQASLQKVLPNHPAVSFHGASADGQKILVLARSDTNPGTFYLFDRATKLLGEVGPIRTNLGSRALASVKYVEVPAADGARIPAYLTIPAGVTDAKNLPAVVLPHGGPSARDEWGFDWLPQFLAARGYVVIQPNYRGSTGYGEAWLAKNGFQNWRTSISDVSASAKYLVSQGIADPKRVAIVGWSYGGYAALQSAVVEPDLYKAVVAIAPVTDLVAWRDSWRDFTNRKIMRTYVGTGPELTEGSPLKHAAAIRAPVLLVHGDQDANVSISQSENMAGALKTSGREVEYLRFDGLDHQLDDSDARVQMLTRIGTLLDRTIGH